MGENFKKFKGGPTPALEHGSQAWGNKTTGTTPTKHPHSQDPKVGKHKSRSTTHSPPVTPHHVGRSSGMMSPVSTSGELRQRPGLGKLLHHGMTTNTINTAKGSQPIHSTERGVRYPKGGMESLRPNVKGQSAPGAARTEVPKGTHMMAGKARVPMHVAMTKSIRGMIGKTKSKRSSYP